MDLPVISSTFLLTLLLGVGLFFFIRASVKDRTEEMTFRVVNSEEATLKQVQDYFEQRAYRLAKVDPENNRVTYEGFVRPSWFLASFLTLLAAIGLLCLSLVWWTVLPKGGVWFLCVLLLSPLAGWFYWKNAARPERVAVAIASAPSDRHGESESAASELEIVLIGHRDELATFRQTLHWPLK
jgi:hypothetical protein